MTFAFDDELGMPKPRAWAYLACPTWYPHAEAQWRRQLWELALDEGYAIERWFVDHWGKADNLRAMLTLMPGAISALFIPAPSSMWCLDLYKDLDRVGIARQLGRQVFVLTEGLIAPIELRAEDYRIGEEGVPQAPQRPGLLARLWGR